jgi:hypothetical protein
MARLLFLRIPEWVAGPQQPWQLGFPESQRSQVGAR